MISENDETFADISSYIDNCTFKLISNKPGGYYGLMLISKPSISFNNLFKRKRILNSQKQYSTMFYELAPKKSLGWYSLNMRRGKIKVSFKNMTIAQERWCDYEVWNY